MLRINNEEHRAAIALADEKLGKSEHERKVVGYEDFAYMRCLIKFNTGEVLSASYGELEEAALKIREDALAKVEEIFGFKPSDIVQTECIFPPTRKRERQMKFLWRHSVFLP